MLIGDEFKKCKMCKSFQSPHTQLRQEHALGNESDCYVIVLGDIDREGHSRE